MTKKTDILASGKPLETLIALEAAFGCMLENIKNIQPELAKSIAIDMQQTATRIPLHLPPEVATAAAGKLQRWAEIANSDPTQKNRHQSN